MGGLFGVAAKTDCVSDLFYGTDYHSHLGTRRGGLAVKNLDGYVRFIHNIENVNHLPLKSNLSGLYKLKLGPWRIIYDIDKDSSVISSPEILESIPITG